MNREKRIFLQKKAYDHLFYEMKDPFGANLFLLILELEEHYRRHGVEPSFSDFSASKEKLDGFMVRNKEALIRLFNDRFSDPTAYCFGAKEEDLPAFDFSKLN